MTDAEADRNTFRVVPVTDALRPALCALDVAEEQRQFVATNAQSLKDAASPGAWPRALTLGDEPVGFMMLFDPSLEGADDPDCPDDAVYLWRLMIDRSVQGRGFGIQAVEAAIAYARERGARRLLVSCVPGPGSPQAFYERLGFEPSGRVIDGEVEMERVVDE